MKLYFAYGSNLSDHQMKKRCPEHRKLGRASLPGYRWIITTRQFANIVKSAADTVEGMLFELSPGDEATLDQKEGVHTGCYGKHELAVIHQGREVLALVYIDPITEEGSPGATYIKTINQGIRDAQLPETYVTRYIRHFVPQD